MKHAKYLLLLLLVASCTSQRNSQYYGRQPYTYANTPAVSAVPTPVVVEQKAEKQVPAPRTWQAIKHQALDSLCHSSLFETTQLGIYVYDLTDGQPLYALNAAHRMRPASCQKLITAITALHFLTPDYQFRTDFRITGRVNAGVLNGDLYIVGGMDPMVTADELLRAAASIKQQYGIQSITGTIFYDLTMREDTPYGWGWCWDDNYGPLSALLVDGKDTFEQNWLKALRSAGIRLLSNSRQRAQAPQQSRSVFTIVHGIDELLEPMMKNSDNIYAECLFYQIAASTGTKWAGRKQAAARTDELLGSLGLETSQYQVADGSGLSLYNYTSAEMLVALLAYAWRSQPIREHLLPHLPIAGYDGTLQKRMIGTSAEGNVRAKTGTVTGISSLAGYVTAANGHTLAFAIINQSINSSGAGRAFQDRICQELSR